MTATKRSLNIKREIEIQASINRDKAEYALSGMLYLKLNVSLSLVLTLKRDKLLRPNKKPIPFFRALPCFFDL